MGLQDCSEGWDRTERVISVKVGGFATGGVGLVEHQQISRHLVVRAAKGGGLGFAKMFDHRQVLIE